MNASTKRALDREGERKLVLEYREERRLALDYIVGFLNDDDRPHRRKATLAGRKRITDLLRDLQRMNSGDEDESDLEGLYEKIRKRLGQYPNPWSLGFEDYAFSTGHRYEATVAAQLMELSGAELRRIKLCVCGNWFAARSYNQEFCPGKRCRQNVYEQTDDGKEKARLRGQKHYWRAKLREAVGLGNKDQITEIKKKLSTLEGESHGSL